MPACGCAHSSATVQDGVVRTDQGVARLDVLVDQAGGMDAADGPRDPDRQAQECADLYRRAE
jgi:hypothetical protein